MTPEEEYALLTDTGDSDERIHEPPATLWVIGGYGADDTEWQAFTPGAYDIIDDGRDTATAYVYKRVDVKRVRFAAVEILEPPK